MLTRILTAAIALVAFFAVFFANEIIFSLAVVVVGAIMVYEAVKAINPGKTTLIVSVVLSVGIFCSMLFAEKILIINLTPSPRLSAVVFGLIVSAFLYMIISVAQFGKVDFSKIYSSAFMTFYITVFMMFIILLREIGRYAVILVFIFSWITDTGAYFAGSLMGKHKLAPVLSPKKTIEGAVGGVILTVVASIVYMVILKNTMDITIHFKALFLIAAVIGALLSELGDLAASALKRQCDVKDFGKLFPGHGGMLDRFDSVVFIAPFVYFVFVLLQIGH